MLLGRTRLVWVWGGRLLGHRSQACPLLVARLGILVLTHPVVWMGVPGPAELGGPLRVRLLGLYVNDQGGLPVGLLH